MRKIFLLVVFLAGCQSEPGPEMPDGEVSVDANPAQASCVRVVAAHERLVARCPSSTHGSVATCSTVTGVFRPDAIEGCIRWHDNVPCADGILWSDECTDLFYVGE